MTDVGESGVTLKIEIKGGVTIEVDSSMITDMDVYQEIFIEGLKAVLSKGAVTKLSAGITKKSETEQHQLRTEIKKAADEAVQGLYQGKMPGRRGASTKRSGKVQNEAMRLAKALVKDTLRANGYKISALDAKEITAFAKEVLASNQELYKKAEENLAQRAEMPVKGLDVKAMLGERSDDENLKAKPKVTPKPKAGAKDVISAAQAGKVAPRARPTAH